VNLPALVDLLNSKACRFTELLLINGVVFIIKIFFVL
jgi:hypothetical protein